MTKKYKRGDCHEPGKPPGSRNDIDFYKLSGLCSVVSYQAIQGCIYQRTQGSRVGVVIG
jgi:hypothetical protein